MNKFNKTANENLNMSETGDIKKKGSKNANEMVMSRTDGGMMGFLNPMKLKEQKSKMKN